MKDIEAVIFSEAEIAATLRRMATEITRDYAGKTVVLLGVLKGALFVTADLARALAAVSGNALEVLLDGEDFLMPSLCLFDRRIFETIGYFNPGRYHEDHEFILRASRAYPVVPTGRRLVVYRQSTSGKCRGILRDFERARDEELSVAGDVAPMLTPEQNRRLHQNARRSLYCRFLMYGFNRHAKRMLPEVDVASLPASGKGRLAWLFARSGINVLAPARETLQTGYRLFAQRTWNRVLRQAGLDLLYG